MPHWLSLALATGCWICALYQLRMYLIYAGRIHSPAIGAIDAGPALGAVAIRSLVSFAIYGFLVLVVPWPRLITYVSLVWLCKGVVQAITAWLGTRRNNPPLAIASQKGRGYLLSVEVAALLTRAVVTAACAFFLGF
jgi:hypothetical protein